MENDYVTKADLKAELGVFRAGFKAELETIINVAIAASEKRLSDLVVETVRDSETRLLNAFYDYSKASDIRFRKIEADHANLDASATQRLAAIELRMVEFERRLHDLRGAA